MVKHAIGAAAMLVLFAYLAAAQPKQVIPAAADTATSPSQGKPMVLEFQQLEDCTADSGLSPHKEFCQTTSALNKPGQAHWYRFNVLEEDSAFTLHFLVRVQNGRVRLGLWFPGQSIDTEPSVSGEVLLSSSFAQEQYITIPAAQLFHSPGIYMLQIMNEYGAPRYSLRADMTPATTLLNDVDRAAIAQVVKDCCPSMNSMVCHTLSQAHDAKNVEEDLCHQGPVQCDAQGHITDLVLQGTNSEADLTCAAFSNGFAALPKLVRLDLAGANLGADLKTISKALAPAKQLRWLVLRSAGVVGEVSCDIMLPSLHLLSLTRNGLTGVIPDCFTKTKTLLHLYLTDNALSGPLPDFAPDSSLELFFARDQFADGKPSLGGTLPASLTTAANLQFLQLSNAGLTGTLVDLPPNMKYFNVSNNQLEGPLPAAIPVSLVSLDFSGNKITGSLPADMAPYKNLVDIQAYYNRLAGPLPSKLPPHLVQLALSGNQVTGTMPALPRGMRYLSVAQNQLQGRLPDGPGAADLWFADLSSNSFSGDIPAALGQSGELVYLNVSRNQLAGVEAPEGWSTPSAITLDASNNLIEGTLFPELAEQTNLAYINFANNKLSGNLDAFAKALKPETNVGAVFDVNNNQLTGGLPEGLTNLAVFNLAPTFFPSWNELDTTGYPVKVFAVSDNNLNGPFPTFLTSALVGLISRHCNDEPGACNIWVSIDGGNNKLTCPSKGTGIDALLPEDFDLLSKQNIGCTDAKDGQLYEISSVLQGKPKKLDAAAKPAKPSAQPATADGNEPLAVPAGYGRAYEGVGEEGYHAAEEPRHGPRAHGRFSSLPPAAIAGIVAGIVVVSALIAALGYVVVYRRWYTVRAAQSFKRMQEGPLAATSGATVNSTAPIAGLPSLTAPAAAATPAAGPLGGDDRV